MEQGPAVGYFELVTCNGLGIPRSPQTYSFLGGEFGLRGAQVPGYIWILGKRGDPSDRLTVSVVSKCLFLLTCLFPLKNLIIIYVNIIFTYYIRLANVRSGHINMICTYRGF